MSTPADDAVAAFGELLVQLGIENDVAGAKAELRRLAARPWADFCRGPAAHRSALTESGAPFELSIKLDGRGDVSLRYVVDAADHTRDLIGNLEMYLDAARLTTGQPDEVLRQLFACHLADAQPGTPATVMHGVGLAAGGRRRSSLYFPASWVSPDDLVRRLPRPMRLPGRAQVVGYDFTADGLAAWKTYHWLSVAPHTPLADHPDLEQQVPCAGVVYDRFAAAVPEGARGTSAFLQRTVTPSGLRDKLFFFSRPWGWASADCLAELLELLAESLALDLGPLQLVRATTRRHNLSIQLGLVAVGGDASVTFYFWPT